MCMCIKVIILIVKNQYDVVTCSKKAKIKKLQTFTINSFYANLATRVHSKTKIMRGLFILFSTKISKINLIFIFYFTF